MKIAVISLNTASSVNPTIRKGNKISQTIGSRNKAIRASGQHSTKRRHQRITAINVLMGDSKQILRRFQKVLFPSYFSFSLRGCKHFWTLDCSLLYKQD